MPASIETTFRSCNFLTYIFPKVATKNSSNPYERIGAKLQNIEIANVPGKKDDPNYAPVRGHVPVELYKKFKIFCLDRGVDNSEGLEVLLSEYFEGKEKPPAPQPQPEPSPEKKKDEATLSPRMQKLRELKAKRQARNRSKQQQQEKKNEPTD
jgi:hypothetical protein